MMMCLFHLSWFIGSASVTGAKLGLSHEESGEEEVSGEELEGKDRDCGVCVCVCVQCHGSTV